MGIPSLVTHGMLGTVGYLVTHGLGAFGAAAPRALATDAEIADILAGRYGPTTIRFRAERRTQTYGFLDDITTSVLDASVAYTSESEGASRTATLRLNPANLPADFATWGEYVTLLVDVLVASAQYWERYSLGLFVLDAPEEDLSPRGNKIWSVQAADPMAIMLQHNTAAPYVVAAGVDYATAAESIFTARGFKASIPASGKLTPNAFSFPAETSELQIANKLLRSVNYFNAYFDPTGTVRSEERIDPSVLAADVTYSTLVEPRMIVPGAKRKLELTRFPNRWVVTVTDPLRAAFAAYADNTDVGSEISTVSLGATIGGKTDLPQTYDASTAQEIAAWELLAATARARGLDLGTRIDPRRGDHEIYSLRLEDYEVNTRWIVRGWRLQMSHSATMHHQIGNARAVAINTGSL